MRALIFDCDGVLAETERDLHLPAFNRAFAEFDLPIRWSDSEYAEKLRVAGGKERMATALTELGVARDLPSDAGSQRELLERLHVRKAQIFEELLAESTLAARPGVARIIRAADAAGWRLAVASTAAESSVRAAVGHILGPALLDRLVIFAGDVVAAKKPDPGIYELAVERLGVGKDATIVVEDSRNGLLAATAAGLSCVITVSAYTAGEDFAEATLVVSSLGDPDEPTTVIANRTGVALHDYVTLSDLEALLPA